MHVFDISTNRDANCAPLREQKQIANDFFAFTYAIGLSLSWRNYIERMKLAYYTYNSVD